jgi:hypothetical protein
MPKTFLLLILIVVFYSTAVTGQEPDTGRDSLARLADTDTIPLVKTRIWPALIRSAIVPGWGQIEQEHPGRAAVFYGLSICLMYNLAWNYWQYDKTGEHAYWQTASRYAIVYAQVNALNLIDVMHSYVFHEDQPWPGQLFSDLPVKSPWGAVARSAMLPGWGQLYNEKYIKSLISLGICFDFARKVYVFNQRYQRSGRKYFLDRRVVNSWYLGLFYALNMVDAYVDAYLFEFDDMMRLTVGYSGPDRIPLIGVHIEF